MQVYCGVPQLLLLILPFLFAVIPWAQSRYVAWPLLKTLDATLVTDDTIRTMNEDPMDRTPAVPSRKKRSSDPWGVCPITETRIDCFYIYLGLYAEILADMEDSDSRRQRNMGKRSMRNTRFESLEKDRDILSWL